MTIRIALCSSSIASCLDTVKALRNDGIPSEKIYVVTNIATRDTIRNNYDLRNMDGSVFSSHYLIQNVKDVITLANFNSLFPSAEILSDYQERIEGGSMVVAIME